MLTRPIRFTKTHIKITWIIYKLFDIEKLQKYKDESFISIISSKMISNICKNEKFIFIKHIYKNKIKFLIIL